MSDHFRHNYNTKLTDEEQKKYDEFLMLSKLLTKRDLSMDEENYDLRGYWKANKDNPKELEGFVTGKAHATDKYKKPNHPTFSDESIYHGTDRGDGSKWFGGKWGRKGDKDVFTPSQEMLKTTHPEEWLKEYMARFEPSVELDVGDLQIPAKFMLD